MIQDYLTKNHEIYDALLSFLTNEKNAEEDYNNLIGIIKSNFN